jgi:hypothetical protein
VHPLIFNVKVDSHLFLMQFNSSSKATFKKSVFSISCIIFFISAAVHISALPTSSSTLRMPSNTAAWLIAKVSPLEVKPAPYTSPRENEIVTKNSVVAINPVDWVIQYMGLPQCRSIIQRNWSPEDSTSNDENVRNCIAISIRSMDHDAIQKYGRTTISCAISDEL